MANRKMLRLACLLAVCGMMLPAEAARERPNILCIVADDLGWADVGYHGSPIKTPNIDRLRDGGVELDQFYVAPMCTPTRTGLLTGRYWSRFGNTAPSNTRVLPFDTVTLATALGSVGYDTAITGKWHLGSKPEWGPRKFGFNHSHGSLAGGVNPWNHLYKHGPYSKTWHRNDVLTDEEGHVTDLIMKEAVRQIRRKREGPFFLYVPFTAVHTPFDEPKAWLDKVQHIEEGRRQYAACTSHMDFAIGQMIRALEEEKLIENTLVIFFSDNGGTNGSDSSRYPNTQRKAKVMGLNHPLRGWKAQVYDGGIRSPCVAYWKGTLKPRKVTALTHVVDWMPTLCSLAGYEAKTDLKWDGKDLWPVLTGEQDEVRKRFYCQGVGKRSAVLRQDNWKLVTHRKGNRVELYDLGKDPYEKTDLASKQPERVNALRQLLAAEMVKDNDAMP